MCCYIGTFIERKHLHYFVFFFFSYFRFCWRNWAIWISMNDAPMWLLPVCWIFLNGICWWNILGGRRHWCFYEWWSEGLLWRSGSMIRPAVSLVRLTTLRAATEFVVLWGGGDGGSHIDRCKTDDNKCTVPSVLCIASCIQLKKPFHTLYKWRFHNQLSIMLLQWLNRKWVSLSYPIIRCYIL